MTPAYPAEGAPSDIAAALNANWVVTKRFVDGQFAFTRELAETDGSKVMLPQGLHVNLPFRMQMGALMAMGDTLGNYGGWLNRIGVDKTGQVDGETCERLNRLGESFQTLAELLPSDRNKMSENARILTAFTTDLQTTLPDFYGRVETVLRAVPRVPLEQISPTLRPTISR